MDNPKTKLDVEFVVERGRGYSPANDRSGHTPIGELPVDAIFSPVKRVNWEVASARVGQSTNYDKLILEIWSACMYTGEAEYDTIKAVKAAVSIPVTANGDIDSPEKAKFVLDYTGADAVMIGRAAQGRPWIFREIGHFLETGEKLAPPEVAAIRDVLLGHLDDLYAFYGAERGSRVARKHIAWYTKGLKNSALFRARMNQLQTAQEQVAAVGLFFDSLAERSEPLEYIDEVALAA